MQGDHASRPPSNWRRCKNSIATLLKMGGGCLAAAALLVILGVTSVVFSSAAMAVHAGAAAYFNNQGGLLRYSDDPEAILYQMVFLPQLFVDVAKAGIVGLAVIHGIATVAVKATRCHPKALLIALITWRVLTIFGGFVGTAALFDALIVPVPIVLMKTWSNLTLSSLGKPGVWMILGYLALQTPIALFLAWSFLIRPTVRSIRQLWSIVQPYLPGSALLPDPVGCSTGDCERTACQLLLLSDMHVGDDNAVQPGGLTMSDMFPWLDHLVSRSGCQAILFVGDVTDAGSEEQWQTASRWFRPKPIPAAGVIGNHDIHFKALRSGRRTISLYEAFFLPYFDRNSYEESHVTRALDAMLAGEHVYTEEQSMSPATANARELWPRLWSCPHSSFDVLLLNSNRRPAGSTMTNAMGVVGFDQLNVAKTLLQERKNTLRRCQSKRHLLLCMHHHVLAPRKLLAPLLVCLDYKRVLDLALEFDVDAIIHGHTHMPYIYSLVRSDKRVTIISCGSSRYRAGGPLAQVIGGPSCFGITVIHDRLTVTLYPYDDDMGGSYECFPSPSWHR